MDFMVILMRYFWCLYLWILRFWFRHRYPRWNQNEREFGEQKRRSKPQWLLAASPAHHHLHLDAAASQLCETRRKCLSVCELQRTQNHGRQKQASHIGVHSRLIRMILIQSLFPAIMWSDNGKPTITANYSVACIVNLHFEGIEIWFCTMSLSEKFEAR